MAGKLLDAGSGDEGDDNGGESLFAEINITPLTDVFLVMVIIFMVSALAVQVEARREKKKVADQVTQVQKDEQEKKSGIKVNLPSGQAQEIDTKATSLVLVIPKEGDIEVAGHATKDAELDQMFRTAFANDKQTQVVLKADKGVAHGRVVNIMERAKAAGLTHLAIGTSS